MLRVAQHARRTSSSIEVLWVELLRRVDNLRTALVAILLLHLQQLVLEMRLRQLTGLQREQLMNEHDELVKTINYLNAVLANVDMQMQIIKDELLEMKEKYGDERISRIAAVCNSERPKRS